MNEPYGKEEKKKRQVAIIRLRRKKRNAVSRVIKKSRDFEKRYVNMTIHHGLEQIITKLLDRSPV